MERVGELCGELKLSAVATEGVGSSARLRRYARPGPSSVDTVHRRSSDMALEVHLPQVVGLVVLEAFVGLVLGALRRLDKSVSSQDGRDGALGWHAVASSAFEHPGQHMASLGGMLPTKVYDELLDLLSGAVRRLMGTLGQVMQTLVSPLQVAPQPLVAGLAADPNALTQLTHADTFGLGQGNELFALRHDGFHLPWHGHSPEQASMPNGVTHVVNAGLDLTHPYL